jgi:hypothetical protein
MTGPKLTREISLLKEVGQSTAKKNAGSGPGGFSRRSPSPHIKGALREIPKMRELICTESEIRSLDLSNLYSLATVMRSCRKWKSFHEFSNKGEDDFALPYFRRFARAVKSYISNSPQERAIPALREFSELIQLDVPSVSYIFTELCSDPREDVRNTAFLALEKNVYVLLKSMDIYSKKSHSLIDQIGTILKIYAQNLYISDRTMDIDEMNGDSIHPHPPNEETAFSIATYLLFQREGLLRITEGFDLLPYAISWASNHYDEDKIDFMVDHLSALPRGFKKEVFIKVVVLANSEPIRECALDLLVDMGVYNVTNELEIGGFDGPGFINRMLMHKFKEIYGKFAENIAMPPNSLLH